MTTALFASRPLWGPFIGGQFVDVSNADTFDVVEPARAQILASVVAASDEIVDNAVLDARRAYEDVWRALSPKERGALLRQVAARIRNHADEIAEICAREVGKPVRDAFRVDVCRVTRASITTPAWPSRSTVRSSTRARSRRASSTSRTASWLRSCPSTGRRSTSRRSAHRRLPPATRW